MIRYLHWWIFILLGLSACTPSQSKERERREDSLALAQSKAPKDSSPQKEGKEEEEVVDVTGEYVLGEDVKKPKAQLKVFKAADHRIQFALIVLGEKDPKTKKAKEVQLEGLAALVKNYATYKTNRYTKKNCELLMNFGAEDVELSQKGEALDCGLAEGLGLEGRYQKISADKPKFD
jgi:hypothetical protein